MSCQRTAILHRRRNLTTAGAKRKHESCRGNDENRKLHGTLVWHMARSWHGMTVVRHVRGYCTQELKKPKMASFAFRTTNAPLTTVSLEIYRAGHRRFEKIHFSDGCEPLAPAYFCKLIGAWTKEYNGMLHMSCSIKYRLFSDKLSQSVSRCNFLLPLASRYVAVFDVIPFLSTALLC